MTAMPVPMFSVLVANFNHADLVCRAVDSVLQQSGQVPGVEVIVVDDGSSDDSLQRLAVYADRPEVRVVAQPNRGQTAAFARALQEARGDWVCLLDADDTFLPHKLHRLQEHIASLRAGPDNLFLCHDLQIVDARTGEPIANTWFDIVGVRRFGPLLHVANAHHFFPFAVTSGMVFGRALLASAMAQVPVWEWPMGADGILGHVAMLLCGEVHYLHEPLGRYLVHGENDFAGIVDGQFRQKPVWHGRWPRKLRFLELLLDSLPLSERERADRLGYLGRVEHAVRAVPLGRPHAQPLLSFVIDAVAPPLDRLAEWARATASAIEAQRQPHCEQVWVCTAATQALLPPARAGLRVQRVIAPDEAGAFVRLGLGLRAAAGGYLCFLQAGDRPERNFVERHLQTHRFGNLPMLTACDLRLLNEAGVVVHAGIQGTAAGWGQQPAQVSPFSGLLRDWALAPLPAVVFRRSPLLEAFFKPESPAVPERLVGWLLCQYMLQMGGATRLAENLVDLQLPHGAVPNASWLSQFLCRHGPAPNPDMAACAEALFAAYASAPAAARNGFSEGWETRFVRWLVQSGGADSANRIERLAARSGDAALARRTSAALRPGPAR